jgi:RND superfamily putative drug exporter
VDVIESWLPLFLFAILFGLSMDYQVFLLSRIRERYRQTGENHEAVTFGLRSTGRLITGAALIMVAVFGGFALGDMVMFQQMGFGLAVAVLVDATIVRSVLVPATITLLGDRAWYLPKWLEWIPNVSIGEARGEQPRPQAGSEAKQPAGGLQPVPVEAEVQEESAGPDPDPE